jgi:plasmid stabilization system protein ParE
MGWKVVFAPQTLEQLEKIVCFITHDDPEAAVRFGDYLVDRAESLAQFPELGTPYRKRPDVRRLLCKNYFIYYRLRRDKRVVEIMDFWHSARREPLI